MSPTEIQNWVSIYLATAICCGFAIAFTTLSVGSEMVAERFWSSQWTPARIALFVPRTWWRWQRRYLTSTPVTLSIVSAYAATLSW